MLWCTTSSTLSLSVAHVSTFPQCLDQWSSITSNMIVLNMVKCQHFQLKSHPSLFHNFEWFNLKAATYHHPVIQKELHELLTKGAVAGFYSDVFVVPKHTGGF